MAEPSAPNEATTPARAPRLPPPVSTFARLRTRAWKEAVALGVPSSVIVTRGSRRGEKRIALTFDDGPDEMTEQYLDVCDALGLRATFFVVGENVAERPELVAEYVRRGHEVAGHGYTHTPFPRLSADALRAELERTSRLLPSSGARALVRPPTGAVSLGSIARTALAGYTTVLWSIDSDDCRTRDARVVERAVAPERVRPGDIVLLHELQPWTLEALPFIVGGLRSAGYELCTAGELLR